MVGTHNITVAELSRQEHISVQTLYDWRDIVKTMGMPVPGKKPTTEDWSAEAKLAVIVETATLSVSDLNRHCRERGLYPNQVQRWKQECLQGFQNSEAQGKAIKQRAKKDKFEIKTLNKNLRNHHRYYCI